jgi:tetratricopeptide (TPR) repeat protein
MATNNSVEIDLAAEVQVMKNEIDALQISIMKQRTPWYKNMSTLISVTALIFSFATSYVSYVRTNAQDIQNDRTELRNLLQRLAALPKDNYELNKKYADDPVAVGFLSGYINQENMMLARQAAEVARKLPTDKVSATEYFAIGLALQNAYNVSGAMEFMKKAILVSNDFNDEIAALRTYANLLFLNGQYQAGRDEYAKSLNIFSRYNGYNDYTKKVTHIMTELAWAVSEANAGFMDQAKGHIQGAENYLYSMPPGPGRQQFSTQIAQAKSMFNNVSDKAINQIGK